MDGVYYCTYYCIFYGHDCVVCRYVSSSSNENKKQDSQIKKNIQSKEGHGIWRQHGGEKRGKIMNVLWYDRLFDYKYIKLDDLTEISVANVIVTKSKVAWNRTTANRYYLGEHTHNIIQKLVNNLSEL